MRHAIAAVALAAGCLSVPSYRPEVAVSYTPAGEGGTIVGPQFELQFASGSGFHFPDALKIDGEDVLGHESDPICLAEDEAGVLLSPTPRLSAHGAANVVMNQLAAPLLGPAVVQVKLDWATSMGCSSDHAPHGGSMFTAFPDGRIVRYDTFADTGPELKSAGECACRKDVPEASGFKLATFWTINRTGFKELRTSSTLTIPVRGVTVGNNDEASCFGGEARYIAFAWKPSSLSLIRGGENAVAFGRDLTLLTTTLPPSYMLDASSALFIDHTSCAAALARAGEHVDPPPLTINGKLVVASARDGIYEREMGMDADVPPGLEGDRFELTGSTRSSFAVWLRFPHPVEALRATLEGATGAWFVPQQVDDRSWIVWFANPISAARTIVIEPR